MALSLIEGRAPQLIYIQRGVISILLVALMPQVVHFGVSRWNVLVVLAFLILTAMTGDMTCMRCIEQPDCVKCSG